MDFYFSNSLFAGDLLEFLFSTQDIPWDKPHRQMLDDRKSQYRAAIGNAVNTIWKQNGQDIYRCYVELVELGVEDKETFAKCALGAADMYFFGGYSPGSFLGYCAIVLGVATNFYVCPSNGIPEIAAEVVALVLMAHQLTELGVEDKETFAKFALGAADMYFSEGYSPGSFLGYCAIVLGAATNYYVHPSKGISEIAAKVVALVLMAHQLTRQFDKHDGWDGLHKTSRLFNNLYTES